MKFLQHVELVDQLLRFLTDGNTGSRCDILILCQANLRMKQKMCIRDRKKVLELSERYGMKVDPDAKVEDISVGMQQRVELSLIHISSLR